MLHTKFCGNRPAGSGEEDFKGFYHIYGCGGHLGHVTSIMSSYFHFPLPESFHKKLVQIYKVNFEKIRFDFFVCTRPWPKVKK